MGDKNNNIVKEKSKTISVYVENDPEKEDSDSSVVPPEHEEQELVESETLEIHQSTRER